jgi:hypothetical protein
MNVYARLNAQAVGTHTKIAAVEPKLHLPRNKRAVERAELGPHSPFLQIDFVATTLDQVAVLMISGSAKNKSQFTGDRLSSGSIFFCYFLSSDLT